MSCTENKKKKAGGGFRIFQRSVKEMGHGDVHLSHHAHGKNSRNSPTNDKEKEPPSENKYDQELNQMASDTCTKSITPKKSSQITPCKTDWQHNAYQGFTKEKTPPRFWKFKVHQESETEIGKTEMHEETIENVNSEMMPLDNNNNMQGHSDSGNVLTQSHSSCVQSTDLSKPLPVKVLTQSHSSCVQSTDLSKPLPNKVLTQSHSSCVQSTDLSKPLPGYLTQSHSSCVQSTDLLKSLPGYLSHTYHQSRTFNHSRVETGSDSSSTTSQNSQTHNAPFRRGFQQRFQNQDSQYQSKNIFHSRDENRSFNRPHNIFPNVQKNTYLCEDCVKAGIAERNFEQTSDSVKSTKSEDWSTELLNLSDWNSDNVLDEHFRNLSVEESIDNRTGVEEGSMAQRMNDKSQSDSEAGESIWSEIDLNSEKESESKSADETNISRKQAHEIDITSKLDDKTDILSKPAHETELLSEPVNETDLSNKPASEIDISSIKNDEKLSFSSHSEQGIVNLTITQDEEERRMNKDSENFEVNAHEGKENTKKLANEINKKTNCSLYFNEFEMLNDEILKPDQEKETEGNDKCEKMLKNGQNINPNSGAVGRNVVSDLDSMYKVQDHNLESNIEPSFSNIEPGLSDQKVVHVELNISEKGNDEHSCIVFEDNRNSGCSVVVQNKNEVVLITENKCNEMESDINTAMTADLKIVENKCWVTRSGNDETHDDSIENESQLVKYELDGAENEVSEAKLDSFEIKPESINNFFETEQKQVYSEQEKVVNGQKMATSDHEIWGTENKLTSMEILDTGQNVTSSGEIHESPVTSSEHEMEDRKQNIASSEHEIEESEQKLTSNEHEMEESEQKMTSSEHEIVESEQKFTSSEHEMEESEQKMTSSQHEIAASEQKSTRSELENEDWEPHQTKAKHELFELTSSENEKDMTSKIENFNSLESCRERKQAKNATDVESDKSTHGDVYDNLIKEKMQFMKTEITTKTDKKKGDSPVENKTRSKSLPESPYRHIVELMQQQFKYRETERNLLLEKQKWYQSRPENLDLDRIVCKGTPVVGRGRAISLFPYDQSPSSSNSDSTLLQDEDWENDLIPLDQYLISDTVDKDLTDDEISEEIANEIDEGCQAKRQVITPVPVSHSYMTVGNCKAQQTPTPFIQKPFISKGRGCLSPDFNLNLSKFLNVGKKEIPVQERKGFNICERKVHEKKTTNTDKEIKPNQLEQWARHNYPEDWENSLIDIDSLELAPLGEIIDKNEIMMIDSEKMTAKNMTHRRQTGEISCQEVQVIENKPRIIENQNFEHIECYSRNDSSSMSSLPQCELLTFSPKSQSTLSGVPTMSDYENSDVDVVPSDVTKNDIQDDFFDDFCSEGFKINRTECQNFENSSRKFKNEIKNYVYDNQEAVKEKLFMKEEPKPSVDFTKDEIDDQFMSYYYPDITSCHCHPSVHQYWVWHTCMCQVPRLCEIRTCLDYWLQYPFRDMDGIYHTVSVPDINNNRKRETSSKTTGDKNDETTENIRDCRRIFTPPGFVQPSGQPIIPPPMPFHTGGIPPPHPRQFWDKMMQNRPTGSECRMSYRGPKPKSSEIPVHLVQHGPYSSKTVVSPFACAQGFYHSATSSHTKRQVKSRHKSETENREHDDSGVVIEGSPGLIGPILPKGIHLGSSRRSGSPFSAINEGLNECKSDPRKRLVDYSYSSTDESEEDRSRSSQVEKRHREETSGVVVVTDESSSESEASKRLRSNVLHVHDSRHFHGSKSLHIDESNDVRKVEISSEKEEGEISDDSEDGSSKFHDCSSTLSNYQILQTVLNKKYPRKHNRKDSSRVDGDSDMVDLTDDGSEVISVESQESSDKKVKPTVSESKEYSRFWASPDSRNESPICGYPLIFPPYTYPGWVSPEMISAGYGSPSSETVQGYQRRNSCSTPTNPLRKVTTSPLDSVVSTSDIKNEPSREEEEDAEERFKRGSVSIRGMEARLRFLRNSKLAENDTTFQSRIAMLQKNKQTETDSESQSSVTITWKVRFLNKCRGYKGTYIDSHCHLDFLFNRSGFGGTWTKFKQENKDTMPYNFEGCVAVFCHPSSFRQDGLWREIAKEDDVWLTFGCHPKNATEFTDRTELNMKMCLMSPRVVALGEIGLDYSGIFLKHKEVQQTVFRKQIQIALDMNKPLVIHCRDAEEDTLAILDEMVPKNYKIHCHCFTGNYESAKKWMDMFPNLFIGLTPLVTYRTALSTHEVARFIPLERLLLETDSPYFVPRKCPRPEVQHSHPGLAITVAEEVAWLKKCPISEVLYSCRQNTRLMYGV